MLLFIKRFYLKTKWAIKLWTQMEEPENVAEYELVARAHSGKFQKKT